MNDQEFIDVEASEDARLAQSAEELAVLKHVSGGEWSKYAHVAMAALSSLPWVGTVITAAQTYASESSEESSYRAMYLVGKGASRKTKGTIRNSQESIRSI